MSETIGLLAGIGIMFFCLAIAYMFYQIGRTCKTLADKDEAYGNAEEVAINTIMEKVGINVQEFFTKKKMMEEKSFRKALENKMVKELLEKEEKKKVKENGKGTL